MPFICRAWVDSIKFYQATGNNTSEISVAKTRMLRWMCDTTRRERMINEKKWYG